MWICKLCILSSADFYWSNFSKVSSAYIRSSFVAGSTAQSLISRHAVKSIWGRALLKVSFSLPNFTLFVTTESRSRRNPLSQSPPKFMIPNVVKEAFSLETLDYSKRWPIRLNRLRPGCTAVIICLSFSSTSKRSSTTSKTFRSLGHELIALYEEMNFSPGELPEKV